MITPTWFLRTKASELLNLLSLVVLAVGTPASRGSTTLLLLELRKTSASDLLSCYSVF